MNINKRIEIEPNDEFEFGAILDLDIDLVWEDDSFDHEFGTEVRGHWEIDDLNGLIEVFDAEGNLSQGSGLLSKEQVYKHISEDLLLDLVNY